MSRYVCQCILCLPDSAPASLLCTLWQAQALATPHLDRVACLHALTWTGWPASMHFAAASSTRLRTWALVESSKTCGHKGTQVAECSEHQHRSPVGELPGGWSR